MTNQDGYEANREHGPILIRGGLIDTIRHGEELRRSLTSHGLWHIPFRGLRGKGVVVDFSFYGRSLLVKVSSKGDNRENNSRARRVFREVEALADRSYAEFSF